MDYIAPKNWNDFQHYKDRSPTWIKLHKSILDNYDYQRLPLASKALAPMLWLLASEYDDGKIPLDYDLMAFRLRVGIDELENALSPLINSGFFVLYQDASEVLAECLPREEKRREYKAEDIKQEKTLGDKSPKKKPISKAERFDEFWEAYPSRPNRPKSGKKPCLAKWKARGLDSIADVIIANVLWHKKNNTEWREGFVPNPEVYINQDRWLDGVTLESENRLPSKPKEKTPEQIAEQKAYDAKRFQETLKNFGATHETH